MKRALEVTMCFVVGLLLGHVAAQQQIRTQDIERSTENMRRLNDVLELPPYRNETWCRSGKICEDEAVQPPIVWIANQEAVRAEDMGYQACEEGMEKCQQVWRGDVGNSSVISLDDAVLFTAKDRSGTRRVILTDEQGRVIVSPYTETLPQMDTQGRVKHTPCLTQMEAAMRAIEDYPQPPPTGNFSMIGGVTTSVIDRCLGDRMCEAQRDLEEAKAARLANDEYWRLKRKVWDDAKSQCWKKP
jgi:hypothetical protein